MAGANFGNTALTASQLYSTASYQAKDLYQQSNDFPNVGGIGLRNKDLTGWNFAGQNMIDSDLNWSSMAGANFNGAILSGGTMVSVDLTGATLNGA